LTGLEMPRSLDYFILRCCERLGMSEEQFFTSDYYVQLHQLSYELIRQMEEARGAEPTLMPGRTDR